MKPIWPIERQRHRLKDLGCRDDDEALPINLEMEDLAPSRGSVPRKRPLPANGVLDDATHHELLLANGG